jgi:biotin synthase
METTVDFDKLLADLRVRLLGQGGDIAFDEALALTALPDEKTADLARLANDVKARFAAEKMDVCAIINAKSGNCCEDCSFCSQSARFKTDIKAYPLLAQDDMVAAAKRAEADGVNHFCLVTSGRGLEQGPDLERLGATLDEISRDTKMARCASLGIIEDEAVAVKLRQSGLNRYHHNLETSERNFPNICSTHTYEDRVKTIRLMQKQGVEICAGGILGMGENEQDRVEMAFALKELGVESIPLNLLNPISGTPVGDQAKSRRLRALDAVKTVAIFRLVNKGAIIRLAGGRVLNLGEHERLAMMAGVNGLLIGNYLTTLGASIERDVKMLQELGFVVKAYEEKVPKVGVTETAVA